MSQLQADPLAGQVEVDMEVTVQAVPVLRLVMSCRVKFGLMSDIPGSTRICRHVSQDFFRCFAAGA